MSMIKWTIDSNVLIAIKHRYVAIANGIWDDVILPLYYNIYSKRRVIIKKILVKNDVLHEQFIIKILRSNIL